MFDTSCFVFILSISIPWCISLNINVVKPNKLLPHLPPRLYACMPLPVVHYISIVFIWLAHNFLPSSKLKCSSVVTVRVGRDRGHHYVGQDNRRVLADRPTFDTATGTLSRPFYYPSRSTRRQLQDWLIYLSSMLYLYAQSINLDSSSFAKINGIHRL